MNDPLRIRVLLRAGRLLAALAAWAWAGMATAADWLPPSPEELHMTSEPKAPGAAAVYLYRQVDRDDTSPEEIVYARIKVLTDEGRKYADVEIPYLREVESVRYIQARTVQPDGSAVEFDGRTFDKTIVKGHGLTYLAKAFAMPAVKVGSIIEYRYRHYLTVGFVFDSKWILSQDLFTRLGKFSLLPAREFSMTYSWPMGLPPGTEPPQSKGGRIQLEAHDVPAFVSEDDTPPEDELKYRVEFDYREGGAIAKDVDAFWKYWAKDYYHSIDSFIDERHVMLQAVAQVVQPGDSDEQKLRKLYARAQQVRNLSFERERSEQEQKRENIKVVHDVADVWNRGYGDGLQVTWLFLAMARAAGFQADPVLVSTRDRFLFDKRMLMPAKLNSNVVVVKLGDQDLFLDPGTAFTPFGLLPWNETGVAGLRITKEGGTWVSTPQPAPADSRVDREAVLELSGGGLAGKLTVTYTGLEALWRRISQRDQDATARRKFLEDDVRESVPVGIEVKLRKEPDWASASPSMVAEFDLEVTGWAESAGRRYLLPVGLFSGAEKRTFRQVERVHPIAFNFHYLHTDDVIITIPDGWHIESVPAAASDDMQVMAYTMVTEGNGRTLQLTRTVMSNLGIASAKSYGPIRDYYQRVRANDEEQIVVAPGPAPAKR
jgi:hypothetical protein